MAQQNTSTDCTTLLYYRFASAIRHIILLGLVLCLADSLSAQSLGEKLGGVATDFQITSDGTQLPILGQQIIKRAESKHHVVDRSLNWAFGYGYGYESFRLEFIATLPVLKVVNYGQKRNTYQYYEMELLSEEGKLLASFELANNRFKTFTSTAEEPTLYTYIINLKDLPLILFEKAEVINITQVEDTRQKQPASSLEKQY